MPSFAVGQSIGAVATWRAAAAMKLASALHIRAVLWLFCISLIICLSAGAALAQQSVPTLRGPVTDLTNTLTPAQKAQLESQLATFERSKGTQIAVLLVSSTSPEAPEQYAIRVVEQWKLGRSKVDDGVLLLVATQDRVVRIEVGHGLEGVLSDIASKHIIEDHIVPSFRRGDIFAGIQAGLTAIEKLVQAEELPTLTASSQTSSSAGNLFFPLFIVGIICAKILDIILPRGAAAVLSSLGVVALGSLLGAYLIAMIAAIFVLITAIGGGMGAIGSRSPFGSGAGFRAGGGGWSGGGGSFGGGGASGRW